MFFTLTTLFSTHGFQHFSFPFTQHYATLESDPQYTESIETRPFKATNTSFKTLLNKAHPNISKRGMDNFFKEATLVLAHKNSLLYPKLFQLEYKPDHNEPERNCHKNHVMKLIRLFLWVAQMQTASLSIFQFVLSLPKNHFKLIQLHWIYFDPMNTDFCTVTEIWF